MKNHSLEDKLIENLKNHNFEKEHTIIKKFGLSKEAMNLIENNNFALLIGLISDQSMDSKRAWSIPIKIQERIKNIKLSPQSLLEHKKKLINALQTKPALHRFPQKMYQYFISLSENIVENYNGDTDNLIFKSLIFEEIIDRLTNEKGISRKKAGLLCLILELDKNVKINGQENSYALMDSHVKEFLTSKLKLKKLIDEKAATSIFKEVYPYNPALVSTFIWERSKNIQ